jgi:hypothetical protein
MVLKRQQHRSTDSDAVYDRLFFRSKRFFNNNNKWFFETREKTQVGPFDTIEQCEQGCKNYIDSMKRDSNSVHYAVTMAKQGTWNVLSFK